jgi:hypothetical protein
MPPIYRRSTSDQSLDMQWTLGDFHALAECPKMMGQGTKGSRADQECPDSGPVLTKASSLVRDYLLKTECLCADSRWGRTHQRQLQCGPGDIRSGAPFRDIGDRRAAAYCIFASTCCTPRKHAFFTVSWRVVCARGGAHAVLLEATARILRTIWGGGGGCRGLSPPA